MKDVLNTTGMKDNPSIDQKSGGNISSQKKGLRKNPGRNFDGGFNTSSGTKSSAKGKVEGEWQGTTRGNIKHTYGVNGQNDAD